VGESRESGERFLFRKTDVLCLACGGFLYFLPAAYPLAFRCERGHSLTLKDLIDALLLPGDLRSKSTLDWWEGKALLLRRLAGRALKSGHVLAAADFQEAVVRVDQWVSKLRVLAAPEEHALPRASGPRP